MNKVEVIVLSRMRAKEFKCETPWAAISISSQPDEFPELQTNNRVGLLRLHFKDMTFAPAGHEHILFQESQASKVLEFAKEVWDKIEVMLVHCEAGISRSSAIAATLSHIYNGPESEKQFFDQTKYFPNSLVYHTILKLHYGKSLGSQIAEQMDAFLEEIMHEEPFEC